jgi:hypothetical protein
MTGKLLAVALAMTSLLATTAIGPARADDWHDIANYPSRVVSITFGSNVLDATHPVTFGSYTVAFAQPFPIIQRVEIPGGSGGGGGHIFSFVRDQLTCTNALAGTQQCEMDWGPAQNGNPDGCAIIPAKMGTIPIPCPSDIKFQR